MLVANTDNADMMMSLHTTDSPVTIGSTFHLIDTPRAQELFIDEPETFGYEDEDSDLIRPDKFLEMEEML